VTDEVAANPAPPCLFPLGAASDCADSVTDPQGLDDNRGKRSIRLGVVADINGDYCCNLAVLEKGKVVSRSTISSPSTTNVDTSITNSHLTVGQEATCKVIASN
jgi:hypothetical protein